MTDGEQAKPEPEEAALMQADDEPSQSLGIEERMEHEHRRRQQDLAQLRYLSRNRQREIAHFDMMGEFGSKVSSTRGTCSLI